jgi:hypothetical protein
MYCVCHIWPRNVQFALAKPRSFLVHDLRPLFQHDGVTIEAECAYPSRARDLDPGI